MKQLVRLTCIIFSLAISHTSLQAQEYDFKNTTYYYRLSNDSLVSSGLTLAGFNFSSASRINDSLFTDGIYFPANDCFGRNLWIRVRHIAEDPNGTAVGINIPATASSPCPFSNVMIGGWAGFLYDFEIHRDNNLTGIRTNYLNALYPTSITVASLETLSGSCSSAEWLSFMIVNNGSTGWSLNSINFTGSNTNSNPGFSDTMAVYTTGGCYPPDGFSYTFPTGADSISFISASCCGYSEFKMSAGSLSHFQYGYEYAGQASGYQGMSMAFGSPPTYTFTAQDVTCKDGNDGEINVNISGGIGPFTYQWSDGITTGDTLGGLLSGTYSLTVIDQNGCGQIADTTITINEPINVTVQLDSVNVSNVKCNGGTDGSIQLFASGSTAVTYLWNTGATDSAITGLSAGSYIATVADANTCLVIRSTVSQPAPINISAIVNGNTITAAETNATFQWINCNDNTVIADSISASITPRVSGDYKVVITKDGCTDTSACVNINIVSGIEEYSNPFVSVYPNPTNGVILISLTKPYSATEIILRNVNGSVVLQKTETNTSFISLDIQQAPGIYFATIKNEAGSTTKKLVIE